MAIRIRKTDSIKPYGYIALCAAEFKAKDGDIYIDDAIDYALRMKFIKDYESEGIDFGSRSTLPEIDDNTPDCNCKQHKIWHWCPFHNWCNPISRVGM